MRVMDNANRSPSASPDPLPARPNSRSYSNRRPNRRGNLRRQFDESVPSPCLKRCALDATTAFCSGCGRSREEIRDWMTLDAEAKRAVWRRLGRAIPQPDAPAGDPSRDPS